MAALQRAGILCLATTVVLAGSATQANAGGRRARLSTDLVQRLATGDLADTEAIVAGTPAQVAALALRHGLTIRKRLKNGAAVTVPAGRLEALAADTDQISGDHDIRSSMAVTNVAIGADQVWEGLNGLPGVTGDGIGVAIIDSGIAPHPALNGRIVVSKDFTREAKLNGGRANDGYGHGTHVAGIVAASRHQQWDETTGVAPRAHLINLKVLDRKGAGKASDVIEAIDWAIAHKDDYNIKVINLSLGGPVNESWRSDPMCLAVERAYQAEIVVVAAAGNRGKALDGRPMFGFIESPANSPYAITVGAVNTKGTAYRSDDVMATYSSRGPTRFDHLLKPDVAAPGNRIRSLLAPGATLGREHPELVVGSGKDRQLELSGTSMAAAVVSGAAALITGDAGEPQAGYGSFRVAMVFSPYSRPARHCYRRRHH